MAPRDSRGVREALVATFRRVMRLYFRDIERLGDAPGPDVRGRVFVANHTRDPTPDELARLVRLRRAACAAIDEARSRLPS